jgi:hypothetical protein
VGAVEKISSKCYKFFKCGKFVLQVFDNIKFQGENVWKKVFQIVENFNFEV